MLFAWLKRRRRQRLLREEFSQQWLDYLEQWAPFYAHLTPEEQEKLRDDVRLFIAERHWEGCNGFTVTEEIRVVVAAYACLLVLSHSVDDYHKVDTILIYPEPYLAMKSSFPRSEPVPVAWRHGESWSDGPVILTWDKIVDDIQGQDGENLILHEFAHQLDMHDRFADGIPQLGSQAQYESWKETMDQEFWQLNQDAESGRPTLLDYYGATDEAEFFAVCTECFFLKAKAMQDRHPRLYEMLAEFYRQDPARRL